MIWLTDKKVSSPTPLEVRQDVNNIKNVVLNRTRNSAAAGLLHLPARHPPGANLSAVQAPGRPPDRTLHLHLDLVETPHWDREPQHLRRTSAMRFNRAARAQRGVHRIARSAAQSLLQRLHPDRVGHALPQLQRHAEPRHHV